MRLLRFCRPHTPAKKPFTTMLLRQTTRSARCSVRADAVRARWCLDVRYGCKQKASSMLVDWVQQIGSVAGLNASNTRLSSGAVGVPESRIEMEVMFESLAEWEAFLAAIPAAEHVQWSQRMQPNVVDGSPTWQVFRTMDVWSSSSSQPASSSSQSRPALVMADKVPSEDIAAWLAATSGSRDAADHHHHHQQQQQQTQQGPGPAAAEPGTPQPDLPLDWKGEPMRLNPGDKLPFKFL